MEWLSCQARNILIYVSLTLAMCIVAFDSTQKNITATNGDGGGSNVNFSQFQNKQNKSNSCVKKITAVTHFWPFF